MREKILKWGEVMKEVQMKMSELCDLIGISSQGVRLYEKYNAIPVFKYEGNGYRYYYFEDLRSAIGVRSYRKMGLGLNESARLCSGLEIDEIRESLNRQEEMIKQELRVKKVHIQILEEIREALNYAIENLNRFSMGKRPAMYHLICEKDGEILRGNKERKLIRSWSDKFPFVRFCPITEKKTLGPKTVSKIAFCVLERYAEFVDEVNDPLVRYFPEEECISGITRVTKETTDYYSVTEEGLKYLHKNNLELNGDIITLLIAPGIKTYEPDDVIADYYYTWFPIKKK